jgi:hypothetical protein
MVKLDIYVTKQNTYIQKDLRNPSDFAFDGFLIVPRITKVITKQENALSTRFEFPATSPSGITRNLNELSDINNLSAKIKERIGQRWARDAKVKP